MTSCMQAARADAEACRWGHDATPSVPAAAVHRARPSAADMPRGCTKGPSMPALPYLPFALGHGEARRRASQVDRALCRPATYPHPAGRIERIETHLSVVYLAGRHAYKRLKPVRFAFVDLATAARRQRCAMAQYRLNKRLAGPLYLDIRPLLVLGRRGVFGRPFRPGRRRCASVPGEYVVRMRRFETDALLSVRCARQAEGLADAEALAATLARHHLHAPRSRDPHAARALSQCRALLAELDRGTPAQAALHAWYAGELSRIEPILDRRQAHGFVRACHGDLHLDNIVRWRQRILMFDCIDFDERLRRIDIASDLAFALMDFCAHDRGDCAHLLMSGWLARTGDYAALQVLPCYFVYRALVGALSARLRDDHAARARYLRTAERMVASRIGAAPCLLLCHGFSGSGKTSASRVLASRLGAIRLSSDAQRKRPLLDAAQVSRLPASAYSEAAVGAVYQRLRDQAAEVLASAHTVIVDASFLRRQHRADFLALASRLGARAAILDFAASRATLEARVIDRARLARDLSDADAQVLAHQFARAEPLTRSESAIAIRLDTERIDTSYQDPAFWQPLLAWSCAGGRWRSPIRASGFDQADDSRACPIAHAGAADVPAA